MTLILVGIAVVSLALILANIIRFVYSVNKENDYGMHKYMSYLLFFMLVLVVDIMVIIVYVLSGSLS